MDINITSRPEEDYLYIECVGRITISSDLPKRAAIVYDEILKFDFKKVLFNQVDTIIPVGLFGYHDVVRHYENDFPAYLKEIKIAVVSAREYDNVGAFWQTICASKGYQFRNFNDLDKAKAWLLCD